MVIDIMSTSPIIDPIASKRYSDVPWQQIHVH